MILLRTFKFESCQSENEAHDENGTVCRRQGTVPHTEHQSEHSVRPEDQMEMVSTSENGAAISVCTVGPDTNA